MSRDVVVKHQCGACMELHDCEEYAQECCAPDVMEIYLCPVCDSEHDTHEGAEKCVVSHFEIPILDSEHCPNCLRPPASVQHRIEIAVAGHCSTCNPIYTPDENLQIKYALEPKDAE